MKFKHKGASVEVFSATVKLMDTEEDSLSGDYTHPTVYLDMSVRDSHGERSMGMVYRFQRHLTSMDTGSTPKAQGVTDTCRCWTACYGGELVLDGLDKFDPFSVGQKPGDLYSSAKLAVRDKLASAASEVKALMYKVTEGGISCELKLLVAAIEMRGIPVTWKYIAHGGAMMPLTDVRNRFANSK